MMAAVQPRPSILERLPAARGRISEDADLSKVTWFRVGGPADILFRPADAEDLCAFLRGLPFDIPVFVLGVGSNILVRDGGMRGVVVRLLGPFAGIDVEEDRIRAGAGALDVNVAKVAARNGLAGLEFLSGIPGTVGGALRMNAGAYGAETKDVLVSATAIDRDGAVHTVKAKDLRYAYRTSSAPADWIFVEAVFQARRGDMNDIAARMDEIAASRAASQPIKSRTGGSTFKNPGGLNPDGPKAWKLIDSVGGRGKTLGGAKFSEQHCNFLINTGEATAEDLERLGEIIREQVQDKTGINLEWEIKRIGEPRNDQG